MNHRISLLAGLLVAQILLIGLVSLNSGESDGSAGLLEFDAQSITGLSVSDGEGQSLDLTLDDRGWRLGELPADGDKVLDVIDSLVSGAADWPVATSDSSRERFEVTGDAFQRRVVLSGADGILAEVYLGTSPGFRRVHARREGDDAIYAINFAVHELPVAAGDWLSNTLFQTAGIRKVQLPVGGALSRDDAGDWSLDGVPVALEAVGRYVSRIEQLTVLGLYDQSPDEETPLGEPAAIVVQDSQGSHRLTFRFAAEDDEYVLTSDRYPGEFTVASYLVEQILIDPTDLLPTPAASSEL